MTAVGSAHAPKDDGYRPLLKWPGGKAREWKWIAPHLPQAVRHYVDPFLGGGAPFAHTAFSGTAFLNDRHERLVALHRLVQTRDAEFRRELSGLAADWDALADVAAALGVEFTARIEATRNGRRRRPVDPEHAVPALAFHRRAAADANVGEYIAHAFGDKARRIPRLERKHGVTFTAEQLAEHAETAVRAGYYTLIRAHEHETPGAGGVADFLFIREFCYGSMFRRNKQGVFNIPYGGSSYNSKSMAPRLEQLASDATQRALARAQFWNDDFETFLGQVRGELGPDDFVFCDPPYDSDFSTYGEHAFGLSDHERLAQVLAALPCRWMLVIKETDDVRRIYAGDAAREAGARVLDVFGKQYGYNVRGRNARDTQHLVLANYGEVVGSGASASAVPKGARPGDGRQEVVTTSAAGHPRPDQPEETQRCQETQD